VLQDRASGYLHLLPIPQRLWQYLTIDYKSFSVNKHSYNMLFVVINRLSKQLYSIPCHKTINTHNITKLFLKYIWCRKGYLNSIVLNRGL
jgi:hypothetical protein